MLVVPKAVGAGFNGSNCNYLLYFWISLTKGIVSECIVSGMYQGQTFKRNELYLYVMCMWSDPPMRSGPIHYRNAYK